MKAPKPPARRPGRCPWNVRFGSKADTHTRFPVDLLVPAPELFIHLVEQLLSPFNPGLIRSLGLTDAGDHMRDPGGLGMAEFAIVQVYVVDDLAHRPQGRVRDPGPGEYGLERAIIALVGKLTVPHVVPVFARSRLVRFALHEFQPGFRIDKSPDKPGAGDAVDMDVLARDPGLAGQVAARNGGGLDGFLARDGAVVQLRQQGLGGAVSGSGEEIETFDIGETLAQFDHRRGGVRCCLAPSLDGLQQSAHVPRQVFIIPVPRGIEQGAQLIVAHPGNELRLANQAVTAAIINLA